MKLRALLLIVITAGATIVYAILNTFGCVNESAESRSCTLHPLDTPRAFVIALSLWIIGITIIVLTDPDKWWDQ